MVPKWVVFLLLVVALELLADVLAKEFAIRTQIAFAVASTLVYLGSNVAWLISLRSGAQLGTGVVLFSVLSALGAVLIGMCLYHEVVGRQQLIGLALGIAALAFLSAK